MQGSGVDTIFMRAIFPDKPKEQIKFYYVIAVAWNRIVVAIIRATDHKLLKKKAIRKKSPTSKRKFTD